MNNSVKIWLLKHRIRDLEKCIVFFAKELNLENKIEKILKDGELVRDKIINKGK